MTRSKHKQEMRLQELIAAAKQRNIEVRTEKLLREVGYRAHSGRCRINDQDVILIDKDASLTDQVDFLSAELAAHQNDQTPSEPPDCTES